MSRELRRVEVSFTVLSPDHLPVESGEQMYADDVVEELRDLVSKTMSAWYAERGHQLLACEPSVG